MSSGQFTPADLAAKAALAGYSWLALELDAFDNEPRWPAFASACRNEGVSPGIWTTDGGEVYRTPADSDFLIAEVEGPGDLAGLVSELPNLPPIPRAIVTTFYGFQSASKPYDPALAKPLIDEGFRCLTECYIGANPNTTPENMDGIAKQLGWKTSQPVFGIFAGKTLADYQQWQDWPGCSVWLAEFVL